MINDFIKKWMIKADHDLKNINIILTQNDKDKKELTDTICFHCQQAVEKYLKAYLISKNEKITKTHNIDYLLEMCINIDADFQNLDIEDLTYYAIEVRYPDDFYMPSIEEAKEAYNKALKVKEFIFRKFNINEKDLIF